jgi:hypothetical protein
MKGYRGKHKVRMLTPKNAAARKLITDPQFRAQVVPTRKWWEDSKWDDTPIEPRNPNRRK